MPRAIAVSRRRIRQMTPVQAIKRAVHEAELRDQESQRGTGASGFTLLRMTAKPLARLVDTKAISAEELQAAGDIQTAFMSMAGALMLRPQNMERVDRGHDHSEPAAVIYSQRRYRAWADHWSMRAKRGDQTMEICIAAIIDERALHVIEADLDLYHGKAKKALIRGLRDYAARTGWVRGKLTEQWKIEAARTFPLRT